MKGSQCSIEPNSNNQTKEMQLNLRFDIIARMLPYAGWSRKMNGTLRQTALPSSTFPLAVAPQLQVVKHCNTIVTKVPEQVFDT